MTQKQRVYQVAKDFNISSEALLVILDSLGAPAKSHMSTVDPSVVEKVQQRFAEEKEVTKAEDVRKQEAKAALDKEAQKSVVVLTPAEAVDPIPAPAPVPQVEKPATPVSPAPPEGTSPPADRPRVERRARVAVDEKSVRDSVKKALAGLETPGQSKRFKKKVVSTPVAKPASPARGKGKGKAGKKKKGAKPEEVTPVLQPSAIATEEAEETVKVTELSSVAEVAEQIGVKPAEIITKLFALGKMATVNQRLDNDTIELVGLEFGKAVEFVAEFGAEEIEEVQEVDDPKDLVLRAPVVTVMGHVDHGKTSLLDYVRKANVVAGEKGGITQHIGAYEVTLANGREVAFLDTPGHEAFTAMRARGAQVTDIVVLVVAADDRVMPQTIEAIDHARAADVPLIVAINKVDKPDANPVMAKQGLANHGVLVEDFGGQVPAMEISAKTGQGIDDLLELILLQADLLEVKANPARRARGVVIESKVEQGRGTVATVLVQNGTLHVGDPFVCGKEWGKVRAMSNERGKRVKKAGPSTPVEVMGWSGTPSAGDILQATVSEAQAKEIGTHRQLLAREAEHMRHRQVTLSEFHEMLAKGEVRELKLIIKADVGGSVEVLSEQLGILGSDEVHCQVIHSGVGQITESDVLLADASNAVVIGFNVKTDPKAQQEAQRSKVDIRHYNIIYEAVEDVKSALSGLLKPEEVEKINGRAEVRQIFRVSKTGPIAGCLVTDGKILRSDRVRLIREGETVWTGKIGNLKRFKDDVREVANGFECGIALEGRNDVIEGDIIEAFAIELVARRI